MSVSDQDPRTRDSKPWRNRAVLERLYLEEGLSQTEIAEKFDVDQTTVSHWVVKHDIPAQGVGCPRGKDKGASSQPAGFRTYSRGKKVAYEFIFDAGRNEFVRHHRLLAVALYGFESVKGKDIHHKNGIGWDNRPCNLELMDHADHTALHVKLRNDGKGVDA